MPPRGTKNHPHVERELKKELKKPMGKLLSLLGPAPANEHLSLLMLLGRSASATTAVAESLAMTSGLSLDMLRPLLLMLGGTDIASPAGQAAARIVGAIFSILALDFCKLIVDGEQALRGNSKLAKAVGWVLATHLQTRPQEEEEDAEVNEAVAAAVDVIRNVTDVGIARVLGVLQSRGEAIGPGGRHDNDKDDRREIALLPTADELAANAAPYLPTIGAACAMEASDEDQIVAKTTAYLESSFRLLRHDFVLTIMETLKPKGRARCVRLRRATVVGVRHLERDVGVAIEFDVPPGLKPTKSSKKGFSPLGIDTLIAIFLPGEKDVPMLAVVNNRTTPEMLAGARGTIVVSPVAGATERSSVVDFLSLAKLSRTETVLSDVLVLRASFFAYQPTLSRLQTMTSVPFADQVLHGLTSRPDRQARPPPGYTLDDKQKEAFDVATRQPFAAIQGPPGTGKTFIGGLVAKHFLAKKERLIVLCYTNHALDQLLEHLITGGHRSIARIGGSCKNAAVEPFRLRELQGKRQKKGQDMQYRDRVWEIYKELDDLRSRIDSASLAMTGLRKSSWKSFKSTPILKSDELAALTMPGEENTGKGKEKNNGFQVAGKKGKAVSDSFLWEQWYEGKSPAPFNEKANHPLWKMSKKERIAKMTRWEAMMQQADEDDLVDDIKSFKALKREMHVIYGENDNAIVKGVTVLGCTTTGACKYPDVLRSFGATVAIVEEAAEILEPHLLAALHGVKRAVLIGDHKQLRPKVSSYELEVESGRGLDLNRSLFERLSESPDFAQSGVVSLQTQHRMHPSLSAVIRKLSYPVLRDADETRTRASLRGVHPDFKHLAWLTHDHKEDSFQDSETADSRKSMSKTNKFEVNYIVALVKFLLQQGYARSDIVVLTPYLGQLSLLTKAINNEPSLKAMLSKLDVKDLRDVADTPQIETGNGNLRLATIDNFQGEESPIVIASMVRSNPVGVIGFMQERERVNVLFSRAREALLVVGNWDTFVNAKTQRGRATWRDMASEIKRMVVRGLPVRCDRHSRDAIVATPGDFALLAPDGGCTEKCNVLLACGHRCAQQCHPLDLNHETYKCMVLVEDECDHGHALSRPCSRIDGRPPCKVCAELAKAERASERALQVLLKERARNQMQEVKFQTEIDTRLLELKKNEEKALGNAKLKLNKLKLNLLVLKESKAIENAKDEAALASREKEIATVKARADVEKRKLDRLRETAQLEHREKVEKEKAEFQKRLALMSKDLENKRTEFGKAREKARAKQRKIQHENELAIAKELSHLALDVQKDRSHEKVKCSTCLLTCSALDGVACEFNNFVCGTCLSGMVQKLHIKEDIGIKCPAPSCRCSTVHGLNVLAGLLDDDKVKYLGQRLFSHGHAPSYWTAKDPDRKFTTVDVTHTHKAVMEWHMHRGFDPGQTGKGRDSHNEQFRQFNIVKVERIENTTLWARYAANRKTLHGRSRGRTDVLTASPTNDEMFELDTNANETLLFHGTGKDAADAIRKRGFDPPNASRGLFGSGFYFAEAAAKSDQYARDGPIFYMFLARVALGRAATYKDGSVGNMQRRPPDGFDSFIGDNGAVTNLRFREFIVYSQDRAYPEWIITYQRK